MEEGIKVSSQKAAQIEENTRLQARSSQWQSEREWRLTASHFGEIVKVTDQRDMEIFCESMYFPKDLLRVPAIRHGRTYEGTALQKFAEVTGKKVLKSGFCVDPQYPFLGASPDAFIEGEDAVVEVKCPYAGRKSKISPGKHFSMLERVDGRVQLKRNNNYFFQIMGQMKLSRKTHGYFVVYTHKDLYYEKIEFDDVFFMNQMLPKLQEFYNEVYCPYIASVLKK